jgi:hypothetical protein
MKLGYKDFRTLQRAAKVADAQREITKTWSKTSPRENESGAVVTALACLVLLALAAVTETLISDNSAQRATPHQHFVSADLTDIHATIH